MDVNSITPEQFLELKKRFDEAENDTTPYAIMDDDKELKVIGDVKKTEVKKYEYKIQFAYRNTPENMEALKDENIINVTTNYIAIEREYKDAWIPPRRFTDVQASLIQLYKFFNIVTEDGDIRDLTPDEALIALETMNGEMIDAMCDVIGVVLGIPQEETQFMLLTTAVVSIMKMAEDFPEVVNGVDFTTGNLSDEK